MDEKRDATEITVRAFDLTLLLPLTIEEFEVEGRDQLADEPANRLERWTKRVRMFPSPWKVDRTYPSELRPADLASTESDHLAEYAEYLYFHPHVRNLLYTNRTDEFSAAKSGTSAANRSMQVLSRDDLDELVVEFDYFDPRTGESTGLSVPLSIRQVQLYLFDTSVAMLALKMNSQTEIRLDEFLCLQDVVRRTFPPYLERRGGNVVPGRCPTSITLDGTKYFFGPATRAPDSEGEKRLQQLLRQMQAVTQDREAPLGSWWESLLQPFTRNTIIRDPNGKVQKPEQTDAVSNNELGLRYTLISDDRANVMSFLAVDDVWSIKPADWARLSIVDDSGNSDWMPYSSEFMEYQHYCKEYFYDRFYHAEGKKAEGANPVTSSTRWHCCGYGFGAVGNFWRVGNDGEISTTEKNDFLLCERTGIRSHFRHHYFKIGLLAHLLQVTLLQLKRQISEAIEYLPPDSKTEREEVEFRIFRERITEIERDFLRFRSHYWSPELSQQVQGQELFELWCGHLRVRQLYELVSRQLDTASEILDRHEQDRQSVYLKRLTIVATVFLLMTPIIEKSFESPVLGLSRARAVLGVVLAAFGTLFAGYFFPFSARRLQLLNYRKRLWSRKVWKSDSWRPFQFEAVCFTLAIAMAALGFVLLWW